MTKSEQLFERAVKRIPGGVNSPVRSYGAIGEAPRFIEKADKCYIYDVDGNRYVDYVSIYIIDVAFICFFNKTRCLTDGSVRSYRAVYASRDSFYRTLK